MEIDETCDCDECTEKRERRAVKPRADLIAAGVLVPVPDGEAVGLDAIFNSKLDFRMNYMMDGEPVYNDGISMKSLKCHEFLGIDDDAEFQPVRLVKLEDVG